MVVLARRNIDTDIPVVRAWVRPNFLIGSTHIYMHSPTERGIRRFLGQCFNLVQKLGSENCICKWSSKYKDPCKNLD